MSSLRIGVFAPNRSLATTSNEQVRELREVLLERAALPMEVLLLPCGFGLSKQSGFFDLQPASSRLDLISSVVGARLAVSAASPHDAQPVALSSGLVALRRWNEEDQLAFWQDATCPQRRMVEESFAAFERMLDESFAALDRESYRRGLLPGDYALSLVEDGLRVGILVLNTVFLAVASGGKVPMEGWDLSWRQVESVCGGDVSGYFINHDLVILLTYAPIDALSRAAQNVYGRLNERGRIAIHVSGYNGRESHYVTSNGPQETLHLALGPDPHGAPGGRGIALLDVQQQPNHLVSVQARSWQVRAREEERSSSHLRVTLRGASSERSLSPSDRSLRDALVALYPTRNDAVGIAEQLGIRGPWRRSAGPIDDLWLAIIRASHDRRALWRVARTTEDAGNRGEPTRSTLSRLTAAMLPTKELLLAFSPIDLIGTDTAMHTHSRLVELLVQRMEPRALLEQLRRWNPTFVDEHANELDFERLSDSEGSV